MTNKIIYILFKLFGIIAYYTYQIFLNKIYWIFYCIIWHFNFYRKKIVLKNLQLSFPNLLL